MIKGRNSPPIQQVAPAFALGVVLLQQLPGLPPAWAVLPILALMMVALWGSAAARWLPPALLGVLWAWGNAAWQLDQRLDPALEGRDLVVTGVVNGLPESQGRRSRFRFRVQSVEGISEDRTFNGTVRLSWYRDPPKLVSGERWRLKVRLKAAHGFANPGGFDYEGWLFREGINATGYVKPGPESHRLDAGDLSLDRWRQYLRDRLAASLSGSDALGLVQALTLGDRDGLAREQWEVLTRTGTNHLIAISGLHVGIVAGLAFFLVRSLWRRSVRLTQWLAADRAAALGAMGFAAAYAGLAGFAVSTQRALIMLAVVFLALLLRRSLRPQAGLSLALGAVLLFDITACLSPGFWLSFAAVAVLAYGMSRRAGRNGIGWRWGRAQWLVAVGLAPLLFLLFGKASLIAPPVNLIAVPLFSLLLLPWVLVGTLLMLLTGWELPLLGAAWVLEQGYLGLQMLAGQSWAAWSLPEKPAWVWGLAFVAVILLLAPRGLPARWTGLILLLPLGLIQPQGPPGGGFRFTLLDVGQGLAAVVQTEKHVLVYDAGPGFPSGFNTGSAVIAPFLRSRGLSQVDTLVVSHADIDHAGGVTGLLEEISVGRILAGEPDEAPMVNTRQCLAGMAWHWDGVDFRILHPRRPLAVEGNNRSCVLRVSNAAGSVLMTGDAEIEVERDLTARQGTLLPSDVLVAGHHGSATSSSSAFLAEVRPRWVLFSAGYRNRYDFPRPVVVERVVRSGAGMADTISAGALEMELLPGRELAAPSAYRLTSPRYWNHRTAVLSVADSGYDASR